MDKWEIRYFLNETALRGKTPAYKETVSGTKEFAETTAKNRLKHSNFKFYEIVKK